MAEPRKNGWSKAVSMFGLVVLGIGVGAGLLGWAAPVFPRFAGYEARAGGVTAPAERRQLTLDSMVVNLAEPGSRRYLRATISLEYADRRVEKEMERVGYRVRDAVIQVLRRKSVADLAPDRVEGLRRELLAAVNGILGEGSVTGLYFREFIIQ